MEKNITEYEGAKAKLQTRLHTVAEFVDRDIAVKLSFLNFIIHLHPWACVVTYKSWAVVTEGGFHVSGLLEVVDKAKAQFGADDTCPHEIGCDLLSADEALPGQTQHIYSII